MSVAPPSGLPPPRKLDEHLHPAPLTFADVDEELVIRGFSLALTRHLQAFHVLTAGSGVWSTEPPPCETPLFSERSTRFFFSEDGPWLASDRTQPPADVGRHIELFIRQLYKGVDLEPPVLVYALVLIERFARCAGEIRGTVRMHTLRPLVVTSLIIACKLYFDEDVFVGDFTRLALGDDTRTIYPLVRCEIGFLRHISYMMIVRPRTFAQYFHAMKNLVREVQDASALLAPLPSAGPTVSRDSGGGGGDEPMAPAAPSTPKAD